MVKLDTFYCKKNSSNNIAFSLTLAPTPTIIALAEVRADFDAYFAVDGNLLMQR